MTLELSARSRIDGRDVHPKIERLTPVSATDLNIMQLRILSVLATHGPIHGRATYDVVNGHVNESLSSRTVYKNIAALRVAGLVTTTKNGRKNESQLTDLGQQVLDAERGWLADATTEVDA